MRRSSPYLHSTAQHDTAQRSRMHDGKLARTSTYSTAQSLHPNTSRAHTMLGASCRKRCGSPGSQQPQHASLTQLPAAPSAECQLHQVQSAQHSRYDVLRSCPGGLVDTDGPLQHTGCHQKLRLTCTNASSSHQHNLHQQSEWHTSAPHAVALLGGSLCRLHCRCHSDWVLCVQFVASACCATLACSSRHTQLQMTSRLAAAALISV